MNSQAFPQRKINIIVVPDAEKENCPPYAVPRVNIGQPKLKHKLQPERVFRDITQSVHLAMAAEEALMQPRQSRATPLSCRV